MSSCFQAPVLHCNSLNSRQHLPSGPHQPQKPLASWGSDFFKCPSVFDSFHHIWARTVFLHPSTSWDIYTDLIWDWILDVCWLASLPKCWFFENTEDWPFWKTSSGSFQNSLKKGVCFQTILTKIPSPTTHPRAGGGGAGVGEGICSSFKTYHFFQTILKRPGASFSKC